MPHSYPGIAACAVIGNVDPRVGMRTVAFVQPANTNVDEGRMRNELVALCGTSLV